MKIDKLDNYSIATTINDFVALKKQEKLIKDQLAVITPDITSWAEELIGIDSKDKTIELPTGDKITLVVGRNWKYTPYVEKKVKELKKEITQTQKIWQIKNPDEFEPSTSVRFKEGGEK